MNECLPADLPANPMPLFSQWFDAAQAARATPNPNAFVLATAQVDDDVTPAARVVLCKGIEIDPGYVVFYTNYDSGKGRQLAACPRASATFFWDHAGRQARITGPVLRSPAAESDAYFASRPWQTRLGAWASQQSQPVASRDAMRDRVRQAWESRGVDYPDGDGRHLDIPRPAGWGGFRIWVATLELWISGDARIHDRARWQRSLEAADGGFTPGQWAATRLQP